jgi:glyoxylase-like metal-dependent hydrolase (beta-lactamase superfamily II)
MTTFADPPSTDVGLPPLFASTPQPLPFAPDLDVRAFLVRRPQGNVLIYSTDRLEHDAATFADLGGIERHYLNHRHEALFSSPSVSAPLFVHERERASVERRLHVRATFSRRHTLDGDLEVIPTPGHTSGATAYLWDTGAERLLFTGDTIYLRDGEWIAAMLDSSDRDAYVRSLELLRGLDFDVLVPWAASHGQAPFVRTDAADAAARIGAIIERLRAGGDS